ncbi:phosphatase PAP2 family protein [Aeromicrobium piscarium]|uniref:Phosphatase PAP2 family protein n=2 Tax=Nocardioidaceae TaxID=85015 RepID=A0A554RNQ6_9ACTN|nr:phosphatase PAP2 family protein [Aeromicrobium piscarium]
MRLRIHRMGHSGVMTAPLVAEPTRSAAARGRVTGPAVAVAIVGTLALAGLVMAALSSSTGQLVDDAAMNAVTASNTAEITLLSVLGRVSIGAILAVAAVCVVIALLRRRFAHAVGALAIIGGANISTQALKAVLDRPDLGVGLHLANSLPSGHTTVVASAVAALVLVLPAAVRPVMAAVGTAAIGLTGLSTIVAGWHRPADVVGALLMVVIWTSLVAAVLGGHRGRTWASALTALLGAAASVVFLGAVGVRPASSWSDVVLATSVLGAVAAMTAAAVTLFVAVTPAHN